MMKMFRTKMDVKPFGSGGVTITFVNKELSHDSYEVTVEPAESLVQVLLKIAAPLPKEAVKQLINQLLERVNG